MSNMSIEKKKWGAKDKWKASWTKATKGGAEQKQQKEVLNWNKKGELKTEKKKKKEMCWVELKNILGSTLGLKKGNTLEEKEK